MFLNKFIFMRDLRNEKPTGNGVNRDNTTGNGADEKVSLMSDEENGNEALEPPSVDFGTSSSAAAIDLLHEDLDSAITEEIAVNRRGEARLLNQNEPEIVKAIVGPEGQKTIDTVSVFHPKTLSQGEHYRDRIIGYLTGQNQGIDESNGEYRERIDNEGRRIVICIRDYVEEIDFFGLSERELIEKLKELQRLFFGSMEVLNKHSECTPDTKEAVIDPFKYYLDDIILRLPCSGKLTEQVDGDAIRRLRIFANALHDRFHLGSRIHGVNGQRAIETINISGAETASDVDDSRAEVDEVITNQGQDQDEVKKKDQAEIDAEGLQIAERIQSYAGSIDFNMPINELTERLLGLRAFITDNIEMLKRHSGYCMYTRTSLINKLIDDIDQILENLKISNQLSSQKAKENLCRLKKDTDALVNRFQYSANTQRRTTNSSKTNGPTAPNDTKDTTKKIITAKLRENAKGVGKLAKAGNLGEAIELSRKICDTSTVYQKLYEKGEHNFMRESDVPDPVTQFIIDQINTGDKFREFRENGVMLRFCELGCGIGNDAVHFARNIPNIMGYHGLDIYRLGADKTRERLWALKTNPQLNLSHLEIGIDPEDFMDWMKKKNNYILGKPNERLIMDSKSAGHYNFEEIYRGSFLFNNRRFVRDGKGLFVQSMKTPNSSTWLDGMHEPVYEEGEEEEQDGYLVGINKEEGILRAFVSRDKQVRLVDEFFDVIKRDEQGNILRDENGNIIISENAVVETIVVPDYDFPGRDEEFAVIIARPRLY